MRSGSFISDGIQAIDRWKKRSGHNWFELVLVFRIWKSTRVNMMYVLYETNSDGNQMSILKLQFRRFHFWDLIRLRSKRGCMFQVVDTKRSLGNTMKEILVVNGV